MPDYISFKIYKFQSAKHEVNKLTSSRDIASLGNHPICNSKKLNNIVDVTIGYPDGKAIDFCDIMFGRRKCCTINVHYRIFDLYDISAKDENQFKDWMYNLYYEKDKLLEEFYTTGKFTNKDSTSEVNESVHNRRQINHIKWKYFLFNIFYFLSLFTFVAFVAAMF